MATLIIAGLLGIAFLLIMRWIVTMILRSS